MIFVFVNTCYIVFTYDILIFKEQLDKIPKVLIDC